MRTWSKDELRMTPPDFDPATAHDLDIQKPVRFPVAVSKGAASGAHEVKASVVFFYCSSRESWCRRGSVDVVIPVTAGTASRVSSSRSIGEFTSPAYPVFTV